MRLDALLVFERIANRKEAKRLIRRGLVRVNGEVVREPSRRIGPEDLVEVNGIPVVFRKYRYYAVNKPEGYVCSTRDENPTVIDLLKGVRRVEDLFPVGRLDKDATGLVLVTNDGELAHRLTHPKYRVPREYLVEVEGEVSEEALKEFERGLSLGERRLLPAEAEVLKRDPDKTLLKLVLYEGKHHQIKRMFRAFGLKVVSLKRTKHGPVELKDLPEGSFRELSQEEVSLLKRSVGL